MMKITWQMPTPLLMYRAFTGVMSGFNFHHCLTTVSMIRLFLLKLIVMGFLESTVVDLTLDFFFLFCFFVLCALGCVCLGYSGIRIYSATYFGIYSGYSGSRIAGTEIKVFGK